MRLHKPNSSSPCAWKPVIVSPQIPPEDFKTPPAARPKVTEEPNFSLLLAASFLVRVGGSFLWSVGLGCLCVLWQVRLGVFFFCFAITWYHVAFGSDLNDVLVCWGMWDRDLCFTTRMCHLMFGRGWMLQFPPTIPWNMTKKFTVHVEGMCDKIWLLVFSWLLVPSICCCRFLDNQVFIRIYLFSPTAFIYLCSILRHSGPEFDSLRVTTENLTNVDMDAATLSSDDRGNISMAFCCTKARSYLTPFLNFHMTKNNGGTPSASFALASLLQWRYQQLMTTFFLGEKQRGFLHFEQRGHAQYARFRTLQRNVSWCCLDEENRPEPFDWPSNDVWNAMEDLWVDEEIRWRDHHSMGRVTVIGLAGVYLDFLQQRADLLVNALRSTIIKIADQMQTRRVLRLDKVGGEQPAFVRKFAVLFSTHCWFGRQTHWPSNNKPKPTLLVFPSLSIAEALQCSACWAWGCWGLLVRAPGRVSSGEVGLLVHV